MADRVKRPPVTEASLRALALRYVERYATTEQKLRRYLQRKVRERGWNGEETSQDATSRIVQAMVDQRYVDDRAWAEMRTRGLSGRGLGNRRVEQDLLAAGVDREIIASQRLDEAEALATAEAFARRRKIGAFATKAWDQDGGRKGLAAMLRAGHSMEHARRFAFARSIRDVEGEDDD